MGIFGRKIRKNRSRRIGIAAGIAMTFGVAACGSVDNALQETGEWLGLTSAPARSTPPPPRETVYCFRSLGVVDCYDVATPFGLGQPAQPNRRPVGNPPPVAPATGKKPG